MNDNANKSQILICDCKNGTQDKNYGPGKRLHYKCDAGWRCSTCKNVRPYRVKKEVEEE